MSVDRILQVAADASPEQWDAGMAWYPTAHTYATGLAQAYGLTLPAAAGVIAALSPGCEWERNLALATHLARTGDAAHPYGQCTRNAQLAAVGIPFDSLYINGPKVRSFYRNVLNPDNPCPVTVDRHAFAITVGRPTHNRERRSLDRADSYERIADLYRQAAHVLRILPNQVQAITWVTWRDYTERFLDI